MLAGLDLAVPLGLGVVSSLHCVQMCGPVVLAYSMGGRNSASGHLCYNAGRIATYAGLGALAGAAGQAMGLVGRVAGIQQAAAIVCGVLMIAAGLLLCGAVPATALVQIDRSGFSSIFSRTVGTLITAGDAASKLLLGMLMGFLPCGLLYAALLKAAATGTASGGAASMAAFGTGTAGALLGLGLFSSVLGGRVRRWSNAVAAISVMAVGALLVWRGLMAPAHGMSCHAGH
jgi:uncharacterized protein